MCTCLIAGRKATVSGKAMLAANDDWDGVPGVLTHVQRGMWPPACECNHVLVGGKEIPKPPETCGYSYTACVYTIGTLEKAWAGGVNDRNVAVAGTGVSAFKPIECEGAWLEPDDVPRLILERAETARGGIRMIGELVAQYGFAPSSLDGCCSAATFAVADEQEGWFLEMAPGGHWVAVRVPDDEAAVRVNAFGTHDADLTDTENVMSSPDLAEFARAQGWWDGDVRHFDFASAFGADRSPNEWGPELDPMNMRRRWRAMCLLSGADTPEDALLYSVRPDRLLSPADFMTVLRDMYEDTPYDLRKAPAAGRYGNPFHDDPPSYSLCRHATVSSFVADFSLGENAVMWTALASPATSCYIPVFADIDGLPLSCSGGEPCRSREPSLFWEWKELSYLTQRRYEPYAKIVRPALEEYEKKMAAAVRKETENLAAFSAEMRRAERTVLTGNYVAKARSLCRTLHARLDKKF